MSLRTIMIFPEFENMDIIDRIRDRYDPLARLVRPHITLVFPFEDDMSNDAIEDILIWRLQDVHPFEIVLNGISMQKDKYGNSLLLDVQKGADEICRIHDIFYNNEFRRYDTGSLYKPHITVGKFHTGQELYDAYNDLKDMDESFTGTVDKISAEMIGKDEGSVIIAEKML
ncbi:MAG: 2'-5' RNA ligase family protein [Oscillospiraceae bacterium]|nr:2'-5' RNA ligase family protein [Oscillospiraceae bacterium]